MSNNREVIHCPICDAWYYEGTERPIDDNELVGCKNDCYMLCCDCAVDFDSNECKETRKEHEIYGEDL